MCSSSADERDPLVDRPLLLLLHAQPERDVVEHLHVGEDRIALEHHRDAAPFGGAGRSRRGRRWTRALVHLLEAGEGRRSVVLPHPDGPSNTMNSRSFTSRSTPSTAANLPKSCARLETDVSHSLPPLSSRPSSSHAPPRREQVLANDEDDDERAAREEKPAREAVWSGDASSAASSCAGNVRLLKVKIAAANTSFQDVTKMKSPTPRRLAGQAGAQSGETPTAGCSRASSPLPPARTRFPRRRWLSRAP